MLRRNAAAAVIVAAALTGCGFERLPVVDERSTTGRSVSVAPGTPLSTTAPAPLSTTTAAEPEPPVPRPVIDELVVTLPPEPLPAAPPDGRGISGLRLVGAFWTRVSEGLSTRLRETPGRIATAICQPIPASMWSASTTCYVADRDGTVTKWTATVVGACNHPVIRYTEGERALAWPTPVPGMDTPVVECPPSG